MEIFIYNPDADRETLDSYNARLLEYSREALAVQAVPAKAGRGVSMSLLTADELEVPPGTACIFPAVFYIEDANDPLLEEKLNEFCSEVEKMEIDEAELAIVGSATVDGDGDTAWYVILVAFAQAVAT